MKRKHHAEKLTAAAANLDLVEVTSPIPQHCLRPAYEAISFVFHEAVYAAPRDKREMRVAAVAVKAVLAAIDRNKTFSSRDVAYLRDVAKNLRSVAVRILPKESLGPAGEPPTSKTAGIKLHSLAELSDAKPFVVVEARPQETAADPHFTDLRSFYAMREKLPSRARGGERFVISRMPILAYPKAALRDLALDRIGLPFVRIADRGAGRAPGGKKIAGDVQDAIVFENQVVLGLPADHSSEDDVRRAAAALSHRLGEHVNPLSDKLLISPGSQLRWLWLVPARAVISGLSVRSASFPWQSRETDEQKAASLDASRRELRQLEDQQAVLLKRKASLSDPDLRRISELKEKLSRSETVLTPEQKRDRLATLKQTFDAQFKEANVDRLAKLDELRRSLRDLGPRKPEESKSITAERKQIVSEVNALVKAVERSRDELQRKLRAKL